MKGGNKHNSRTLFWLKLSDKVKTALLRHFNIQKNQIGCLSVDQSNSFSNAAGFAYHTDLPKSLQPQSQAFNGSRLIIDDQSV
jgi:hypothetical protein